MLIVGLTGGIACGKTTVADFLRSLEPNIPVIDLDLIAREVVEPGKPAYQKIVAHFGKDILFPDGTLDRKKLGAIIFNDAEQRRLLGSFTRGPILWEMFRRLLVYFAKGTDIVVLDAPLLFESGLRRIASYIIVVSVPEELQLKRLLSRDGSTEADAKARMASQMPLEKKRALATVVLDNSGSKEEAKERMRQILIDVRNRKSALWNRLVSRNTVIALLAMSSMLACYKYFC